MRYAKFLLTDASRSTRRCTKGDRKAASSGFKAAETKAIVLNVNDRICVAFQMKLGTASETASVEGSSSPLNDFVMRDREARNPDGRNQD